MARKRANLTDLLNDLTYRIVFDKFKLLSQSAHEWEGLPEGIESRHIERHLFGDGKAIFFRHPQMSCMCTAVSNGGKFNWNHDPLFYNATWHGGTMRISADKCVIIENNPLRIATRDIVTLYVNKITEAERTMDVNVKSVKTPFIFACDDKDVLTFKRIFQMIDGNTPAIFADRNLNLDAISVFKTEGKFLGNELMDYKKSVENELLTILGFNNLAVDKKERVNLSEANSNNQITETFADLQLSARKKACDLINEKFGLSISVKRREVAPDVAVLRNEADNRAPGSDQ